MFEATFCGSSWTDLNAKIKFTWMPNFHSVIQPQARCWRAAQKRQHASCPPTWVGSFKNHPTWARNVTDMAKCKCVKILDGWGKMCERPYCVIKLSSFEKNCPTFCEMLSYSSVIWYNFQPFHPKIYIWLNYVQFKCYICHAFLGVKLVLYDFICVKNCNFATLTWEESC